MNDPDEYDIDQLREALANRTVPPPDAVPTRGLDRQTILAFNESALSPVRVEDPQPMLESPDGQPIGVPAQLVGGFTMGRPMIPRHELDDAGLTEADVPGLRVVDVPRRHR